MKQNRKKSEKKRVTKVVEQPTAKLEMAEAATPIAQPVALLEPPSPGRGLLPKLKRLAFVGIIVASVFGLWTQLARTAPGSFAKDAVTASSKADVLHDFYLLSEQIRAFEDKQNSTGIHVVDDAQVQQEISDITNNASLNNVKASRQALVRLTADFKAWNGEYNTISDQQRAKAEAAKALAHAGAAAAVAKPVFGGISVPIVMYHYTPADFETQLLYLIHHNYTTIDLDQLVAALNHRGGLPAKPIIITFDDGYANQMNAFALLQKYGMKATFFIINGGQNSNYCIGANRTNTTCGDAYLSWDQIRQLDTSGLITIGFHTIDHLSLPTLSADQQRYEIIQGKADIEAQLGHPVRHFAYPYGSYNATSIAIVRQAGFASAVSTLPGTIQSLSNLYTLYRIRVVNNLP